MQVQKTQVTGTAQTLVFTAGVDCVASIYLCSTGTDAAKATLWIGSGAAPANGERIEYGIALVSGDTLERGGIPLVAGEKVFVQLASGTVDVRVCGVD